MFLCETVFLGNNQISSLPTDIGLLSSLQTFYLSKCAFDEIVVIGARYQISIAPNSIFNCMTSLMSVDIDVCF